MLVFLLKVVVVALENYVLGQYSYQIEKKDKDINLWNNKKVIKFKEIDNLNPFSFFLIITGTSADKSVQEYSMEEKYDRFISKKPIKIRLHLRLITLIHEMI